VFQPFAGGGCSLGRFFYLCFVSVFCVLEQCSRPVTSTFEVAAALAPLVRPVLLVLLVQKPPLFFLMKFGQRPFDRSKQSTDDTKEQTE
jgi:hypothetical protein